MRQARNRLICISLVGGLFLCVLAAAAQAPAAPGARFVVVLDAAHGGGDQGARLTGGQNASQNQTEKNITQAFALRLRALLAARGIAVVATREGDSAVDSSRRAEIANHAHAQACLSLHASASGSGVHLYVSSLAPAEPGRLFAWKTAQAAYVTRSLALAGSLNAALGHAQIPVTLGRTALVGVDSMSCPAVAVEVAPLLSSNHTQTAALSDANYQARVAQALAAALVQWRTAAVQP